MQKRLKNIFSIAAGTAVAIVLFQIFYLYNNFDSSRELFNKQLSGVLQQSIDLYKLRQIEMPKTLKNSMPFLGILMTPPDSLKVANWKFFKTVKGPRFKIINVDPQSLPAVNQLVTRLISRDSSKVIQLGLLTNIYRSELRKAGIVIPFKLSLRRNAGMQGKIVTGSFSLSNHSMSVEARFNGVNRYLLAHNVGAVVISAILIFLSAGSMFFMGIIIRRQMKLDIIKNEFISNITHELRTPISVLKSTHEALYQFGESGDQEKTARYLQLNTGILNKMEENVDRILNIAEYEQGTTTLKLQQVDINELVDDVVCCFNPSDAEMISFENNLPQPVVRTDRYVLETILSNLIDNALKYSDKYKAVKITFEKLPGGWQLQVADSGKGIPRQYLPFIFDKFYRVPSGDVHDVKGYGLGLSYVKHLVDTLNGTVSVSSKFSVGTTFIIHFPDL